MKFLVTLSLIFSASAFSKTQNCVLSIDSTDSFYIYCSENFEKSERTYGRDNASRLAFAIKKANEYRYEVVNCPDTKTCILKKIENQSSEDKKAE